MWFNRFYSSVRKQSYIATIMTSNMWEKSVNSLLLQWLNPSFKIRCSPMYPQKIDFLEILKIIGLTALWCIFTKHWKVKSRKRQCKALATALKPKSKKKRWERKSLVCLLFKNFQNLLRLERPLDPIYFFTFFFRKENKQLLSHFPFGPSFLCKQKYYLISVWVLAYCKRCAWCFNNC